MYKCTSIRFEYHIKQNSKILPLPPVTFIGSFMISSCWILTDKTIIRNKQLLDILWSVFVFALFLFFSFFPIISFGN